MDKLKNPKVAVVMENDGQLEIFQPCIEFLEKFGVEVIVNSKLNDSKKALEYAKDADNNKIDVIIVGCDNEKKLAHVIAGATFIPVIKVPVKKEGINGLDLLMPMAIQTENVPVATVAVNGTENAALLAVQILSTAYNELRGKMKEYKEGLRQMVEQKDKLLREQYL
ncbi:UNVERIFIED_CONTAM: 5-(carboxyamino)imidazole ribonucleotide mutase [Acetivibrio alkalicellulosi]